MRIHADYVNRNLLSDEQAIDFKLFMTHLPALLMSIQHAGLMSMPQRKGKGKTENGGDAVSVTMYVVGDTNGSDDPPGYVQNEKGGVDEFEVTTAKPVSKKRAVPSELKKDSEEFSPQDPQIYQSNPVGTKSLQGIHAESMVDKQIPKGHSDGPISSLPPQVRKGLSVHDVRNLLLPDSKDEELGVAPSDSATKDVDDTQELISQQKDLPRYKNP